jgi:hypothetical protein
MRLTRTAIFLGLMGMLTCLSVLAVADAVARRSRDDSAVAAGRALVRANDLTDLCLFTDARYTRHPSLADRHSPFQDSPLTLEHFPTGSLARPPRHLITPPTTAGQATP